MTETELKAIEKRAEKATPGPWHWSDPFTDGCYRDQPEFFSNPDTESEPQIFHTPNGRIIDAVWHNDSTAGLYISPTDAEFIAAARTDIPALLAHIRAVEAERDRVRGLLRETTAMLGTMDFNGRLSLIYRAGQTLQQEKVDQP